MKDISNFLIILAISIKKRLNSSSEKYYSFKILDPRNRRMQNSPLRLIFLITDYPKSKNILMVKLK